MDKYEVNLKSAVSWSFEFEDQEWFAGFRELATHGIDKPVLNIFRMFGMMSGKRISVKSEDGITVEDIITKGAKEKNDISAIASLSDRSACVMIWNYHDDDKPGAFSPVEVTINGLSTNKVMIHHYRVDQHFSNSFEKWKQMGKPQEVTDAQYRELDTSGQLQLCASPEWIKTSDNKFNIKFDLPAQGVSFIRMSW